MGPVNVPLGRNPTPSGGCWIAAGCLVIRKRTVRARQSEATTADPAKAGSVSPYRYGWRHTILPLTLELTIKEKDQLPDLILLSHTLLNGFAGVQHSTMIAAAECVSDFV
jgi:hypothetical protein